MSDYWYRFANEMPKDIFVLGRWCRLDCTTGGNVEVHIDDTVDAAVVSAAELAFECRKWINTTVGTTPLSLSETSIPTTSKSAITDFLQYFLQQKIGPRMLTFDQLRGFRFYRDRENAVTQAYLTWFATHFCARRQDGRLKHAIPCSGYFKDDRWMCQKSVLDLSACCPSHKRPNAKTLFTFYPRFRQEGFPELSCDSEFQKPPTQPLTDVEREQRSRNATNKAKLFELLLSGQHGNVLTRRQVSDMLETASGPGEPGNRRVQDLIRKCEAVFVFWSWDRDLGVYHCTYADRDAKILLQATETKSNQRDFLYNELLNRWLEEKDKQLALHDGSLASIRRRLSH